MLCNRIRLDAYLSIPAVTQKLVGTAAGTPLASNQAGTFGERKFNSLPEGRFSPDFSPNQVHWGTDSERIVL
jgi:hypothetical protein